MVVIFITALGQSLLCGDNDKKPIAQVAIVMRLKVVNRHVIFPHYRLVSSAQGVIHATDGRLPEKRTAPADSR